MCFSEGIISYMKKQAAPAAKEISGVGDMDKFVGHFDGGVVGKFSLISSD